MKDSRYANAPEMLWRVSTFDYAYQEVLNAEVPVYKWFVWSLQFVKALYSSSVK